MNMFKRRIVTALTACVFAAGVAVPVVGTAHAESVGISGSTTWLSPCNYFTSANARVTTQSSITVTLSSVGVLGVKFRVLFTGTGLNTGAQFWSGASNTAKTITSSTSSGKEFRNQFSCVNPRSGTSQPSTNFSGNETY
jgi:hypothetical protein